MTEGLARAIFEEAMYRNIDVDLHDDYFGRGMYANTTYAISGDLPALLTVLLLINPDDVNVPDYIHVDSMGGDTIIY